MTASNNPMAQTSAPDKTEGAAPATPEDLREYIETLEALLEGEMADAERIELQAELDAAREQLAALEDLANEGAAPDPQDSPDAPDARPRCCAGTSCRSPNIHPVNEKEPHGLQECARCGLRFKWKDAGLIEPTKQEKAAKAGIRCPSKTCQSYRNKVLWTQSKKNVKVRKRACDACGHTWTTEETTVEQGK